MGNAWLNELFPGSRKKKKKDCIMAETDGIYLTAKKNSTGMTQKVNLVSAGEDTQMKQYVSGLKETHKELKEAQVYENYVKLEIKDSATKTAFLKNVHAITNELTAYAREKQYESGCEICGRTSGLTAHRIRKEASVLCAKCLEKKKQQIEKEQKEPKKSRLFAGIAGSFLGALLGSCLWAGIIIYGLYQGQVAVAAIAAALLSLGGYRLLGKELDKRGFVISAVISVITILAANHLAWTYIEYHYFGSVFGETFGSMLGKSITWISHNELFLTPFEGISTYFIGLIYGMVLLAGTVAAGYICKSKADKNQIEEMEDC